MKEENWSDPLPKGKPNYATKIADCLSLTDDDHWLLQRNRSDVMHLLFQQYNQK
jgi:hypothetical protein